MGIWLNLAVGEFGVSLDTTLATGALSGVDVDYGVNRGDGFKCCFGGDDVWGVFTGYLDTVGGGVIGNWANGGMGSAVFLYSGVAGV